MTCGWEGTVTHTHTHTHTHSKTKQDHESRHLWWLESQMTTEPLFQRWCVEQGRVAWVHQTWANASPLVCTLVNVGVLPGWGSRGRAEGVSWGKVLFLQGLDQIGSVFGVHTPQRALPINLEETTTHTDRSARTEDDFGKSKVNKHSLRRDAHVGHADWNNCSGRLLIAFEKEQIYRRFPALRHQIKSLKRSVLLKIPKTLQLVTLYCSKFSCQ